MKKEIILVRHAESIGNAGKRTTTPAGNNLTDIGRRQAKELADGITKAPDLTEEWPDIQEFTYLSPRKCFNTTPEERKPWVMSYWEKMNPEYRDGDGAESFSDMIERARKLITKVKERPESIIMIFTHGQFMEAIRILLAYPKNDCISLMKHFNENQRGKTIKNCEILKIIQR